MSALKIIYPKSRVMQVNTSTLAVSLDDIKYVLDLWVNAAGVDILLS
jgi:hypothetical protein